MHGHIIQFSWSQEHPVPTSSVTEVSSKLETRVEQSVQVQDAQTYICCSHMSMLRFVNGSQVHIVGNENTPSSHVRPLHVPVFANFLGKTSKISGRPLQVLLSDSMQIQMYIVGNEIPPSVCFLSSPYTCFTNFLGQTSKISGRALQVLLEKLADLGCEYKWTALAMQFHHPQWVAVKLHRLL